MLERGEESSRRSCAGWTRVAARGRLHLRLLVPGAALAVALGVVALDSGPDGPAVSASVSLDEVSAAAGPSVPAGGAEQARIATATGAEALWARPGETADPRPPRYPAGRQMRRARRFASGRSGLVSFAVVDNRGRLAGHHAGRDYVSASIVKAPLMAAELRRLDREGSAVDAGTESLLRAMITYSDNASADAIYYRNGDSGLYDVARRAGMRRFTVQGHWGNARVTAADLARLMDRLDRVLPRESRRLAHRLLAAVVPQQRWGIPEAVGSRWAVELKGGWRSTDLGQLVHQAAALRRGGMRISLAVLTDGQPSQAYGIETVRGIAKRLLSRRFAAARRPPSRSGS
jgi:beta-lactamase class A